MKTAQQQLSITILNENIPGLGYCDSSFLHISSPALLVADKGITIQVMDPETYDSVATKIICFSFSVSPKN